MGGCLSIVRFYWFGSQRLSPVPETSLYTLCFPTDFLLLAGTEPRGKTENPFVFQCYFLSYLLPRTDRGIPKGTPVPFGRGGEGAAGDQTLGGGPKLTERFPRASLCVLSPRGERTWLLGRGCWRGRMSFKYVRSHMERRCPLFRPWKRPFP